LPFAFALAALDMAGFAAFLGGATVSVAITSVLASQYAIVAVVGSYLALGERLSRLQMAGVALTVMGVAALAALRA
jgi:drug/metabolite transporter (DMT)-like permease